MSETGSITHALRTLEGGDGREEAARKLWGRYFPGIRRYALRKLQMMLPTHRASHEDAEDVAARAFAKVCRGIEAGRLRSRLAGRDDFLRVLRWSARGEAINRVSRRPEDQALGGPEDAFAGRAAEAIDPELLLLAEEECRRLLELLDDAALQRIALWTLLGHERAEIARGLGCTEKAVEHKIRRIREKWAAFAPTGPARRGCREAPPRDVAADPGEPQAVLRGMRGDPEERPPGRDLPGPGEGVIDVVVGQPDR